MIDGLFIENVPWVEVVVIWGKFIQKPLAILDTGFSGDLQITSKMAKELDLKATTTVQVQIANGSYVKVPLALAVVSLEGIEQRVQVLISESTPLVGINLLSKFSYKAIVDCHNKTVALQKVT